MASTLDDLESLVLTGVDVKDLTGWPDAMIEDYLNILRNLASLATAADDLIGIGADNEAGIAQNQATIDQLGPVIADINELAADIYGDVGRLGALISMQSKRMNDLEQLAIGV